MAISFVLHNAQMTQALGIWLGRHLVAGTTLLLQGDLGSGKTTLVKGLGKGLGITEAIDSPTFALINEYPQGRIPLYHVDLYRINAAESDRLFLEIYWEGVEYPPGIMAIEWAEHLQYLPPDPLKVAIAYRQSTEREIILTPSIPAQATLLEALTPDAILADEV